MYGVCFEIHVRFVCRVRIVGVSYRPSEFTYAFGGALLVCKSEYASKWTLTKKNFKAIKEVRGSDEAQLVSFFYYYYYNCKYHHY